MTGVQTCALDRKSTRLNSSHTIISYAVFCLKKKKSHSRLHAHAYELLRACVSLVHWLCEPAHTRAHTCSPHRPLVFGHTRLLFFFFLIIRPPPRSPLFPSPTLFR